MFDRYDIDLNRGPSVQNVNVTVKEVRAPTDESIRLLNEMQEKARQNILDAFTIKNNGIEGKVVVDHNPMTRQIRAAALVKINGKKLQPTVHIDWSVTVDHRERLPELFRLLTEALAKEIAQTVLLDSFVEQTRHIRG